MEMAGVDTLLSPWLFILGFCPFSSGQVGVRFPPRVSSVGGWRLLGGFLLASVLTPYALRGPRAREALSAFPSQGSPIFPSSLP